MVALIRQELSGWGRFPVCPSLVARPADVPDAIAAIADARGTIARGNGRAYGDAAIGERLSVDMLALDRLLDFNSETGMLVCEAGTLLADILDVLLPRGWIVPVTPGTSRVTVGGMIAADVHGKNHHVDGSFTAHVAWIDLATGDGEFRRCSADQNSELFAATCGGMGLTGAILRAAIRLKRVGTAWIRQRTLRAPDLAAALGTLESSLSWTYSVAWIDCLATGENLGRSVVFLGEHAEVAELPVQDRDLPFQVTARRQLGVPFDFPASALSRPQVRAFNQLYYLSQRPGDSLVPLDRYFYPLDAISKWNRIYGKRGFVQFQCVLPLDQSETGLRRLLAEITSAGSGSFLAVLKRMGQEGFGLLSFPREGYTLALDFPVSEANLTLLNRLDQITADHGGRIYLAKDACARSSFAAGYDRLNQFRRVRKAYGLTGRFESHLSKRLGV